MATPLLTLAFMLIPATPLPASADSKVSWDKAKAEAYHRLTAKHVQKMVEKLQKRGQKFRQDGLPRLGGGDALCLPCHTLAPGTARSLTPIHITMIRGMEKGLTDKAPKDIRLPLCVDCHAYAYPKAKPEVSAELNAGDLRLDNSNLADHRPCLQPQCHTDRDFPWALTFLGHMKQAVKAIPNDEFFHKNTRYETLGIQVDGFVGRGLLKKAGIAMPWLLIAAMLTAGYYLLIFIADRATTPSEEPQDE